MQYNQKGSIYKLVQKIAPTAGPLFEARRPRPNDVFKTNNTNGYASFQRYCRQDRLGTHGQIAPQQYNSIVA